MAIISGTTAAPSYVTRTPDGSNFDLAPLLTVGDEIPLLEGDLSSFTTSSTQTYAFAGIPDGLGVYNDGTYNYVFLNHEISATSSSGAALTSDISSTVPGKIQGARVSLLVFDQDWNAVGGKYVEGGQLLRAIPKDSLTGAPGDFQVGTTDSSGFPASDASNLPLAAPTAGTSPPSQPAWFRRSDGQPADGQ